MTPKLVNKCALTLGWIQQEAGTSAAIFEDIQTDLDYIQDRWVPGIRRFLKTVEAEIKFTGIAKPQTYRQDDVHIMDSFREHGYSLPDLKWLNRCRQYFQVARDTPLRPRTPFR
jgi:hypothetical protein